MSDKTRDSVTRRDFIVGGAALAAGTAAAGCLPGVEGKHDNTVCAYTAPSITREHPKQAGRVVWKQTPNIVTTSGLDPTLARTTLEKVLLLLTGKTSLDGAWDLILPDYQPTEVVGIKVNVLNTRVPTHPTLVKELVGMLKARKGIKGDQIIVWDRRLDELTQAGYKADDLGCRLEATLDAPNKKGNGRGYEFESVCVAGLKARLSNIQTRAVDHQINFAVMKNHFVTGYTGALKNHYGTIHNPGDFHGSIHRQAVPAVNALEEVTSKARLWLLDATIGICYGDTDEVADCTPLTVAASLDPVALDSYGRQLRDEMATKTKIPETKSDAWLAEAEKMGLGQSKVKAEQVKG